MFELQITTFELSLLIVFVASVLVQLFYYYIFYLPTGRYRKKAEDNADLLALELIAPAREIISKLSPKMGGSFRELMDYAVQSLKFEFGLPDSIAKLYGYYFVDTLTHGSSIKEWLGLDR